MSWFYLFFLAHGQLSVLCSLTVQLRVNCYCLWLLEQNKMNEWTNAVLKSRCSVLSSHHWLWQARWQLTSETIACSNRPDRGVGDCLDNTDAPQSGDWNKNSQSICALLWTFHFTRRDRLADSARYGPNPSHHSLPVLLQDWLHGFPGLFTDTSEHIRFLLFSFYLLRFLVVVSVR